MEVGNSFLVVPASAWEANEEVEPGYIYNL